MPPLRCAPIRIFIRAVALVRSDPEGLTISASRYERLYDILPPMIDRNLIILIFCLENPT